MYCMLLLYSVILRFVDVQRTVYGEVYTEVSYYMVTWDLFHCRKINALSVLW
jgi:hypothetical protein